MSTCHVVTGINCHMTLSLKARLEHFRVAFPTGG